MPIAQVHKDDEHLNAIQISGFIPPKGDVGFINEIPPELLSRIFELGRAGPHSSASYREVRDNGTLVDPEDEADGVTTTDLAKSLLPRVPAFPLRVSQVCRQWRNVAISTPSLWTVIVVSQAPIQFDLIAILLERSKTLSIDITVWSEAGSGAGRYSTTHSSTDFTFLLSMLVPHIHRWRSLRMLVCKFDFMYAFLSKVSDPSISAAPNLETLELEYNNPKEYNNINNVNMSKRLTLFGGSAPLLTRLRLVGVHVNWAQPWISSPSNLKAIQFAFQADNPTWVQFSTTLHSASALEKLAVGWSGPFNEPTGWFIQRTPQSPADFDGPIQLPRVTEFVLKFLPEVHARDLLCKLYLPALNNLTLNFWGSDYTPFIHELVGSATSPSGQGQPRNLLSRLNTLQILGLRCRTDCVEMLYGELQNVTSLVLSMQSLPEKFLDILGTPCAQGGVWLPRLQTLSILCASGKAVRTLVERRKKLGMPLKSLCLQRSPMLHEKDVAWLRENVEVVKEFIGSRSM